MLLELKTNISSPHGIALSPDTHCQELFIPCFHANLGDFVNITLLSILVLLLTKTYTFFCFPVWKALNLGGKRSDHQCYHGSDAQYQLPWGKGTHALLPLFSTAEKM